MTTVVAHGVDIVDSLSLLSLKVAPNVFDLSSGMHHVSIRDQIVRARLVIRDLKKADITLQSILIVGCGVAGLAAAIAAQEAKISEILVVDSAEEPLSLFKGVTERYVGPYMYEWPSQFFGNQSFPSHSRTPWIHSPGSPLSWTLKEPCNASYFSRLFLSSIKASLSASGAPKILLGVSRQAVRGFVKDFARNEGKAGLARIEGRLRPSLLKLQLEGMPYPSKEVSSVRIHPQYVFLAGGMGNESTKLVQRDRFQPSYSGVNFWGKKFWENDQLRSQMMVDRHVYIFGGGDGAIQDALRTLTGMKHPLEMLKHLNQDIRVKNAIDRAAPILLSMDRQGRQQTAWTHGPVANETLDDLCRKLAVELSQRTEMCTRVANAIRPGRGQVFMFVKEGYIAKAYLLNRFLIHLIAECSNAAPRLFLRKIKFAIFWQHQAWQYSQKNGQHHVEIRDHASSSVRIHMPDEIVVRYGIEAGSVPGAQMIHLSPKRSRQRTTLARVELPFAPN
ncbi:hypothetical protein [Herbaspirillum seropedicae]|uniref:hypothetical protein n=1 Tax=Herbaspirillum seropedicae TaxID=964 RepID=UPI000863B4D9|nr:hypothetical protein [Herbaspirillum seropedicae]AON53810.1 hypothetical protein Hsc_1507 [Herbaspirillum seropedicae]